MKPKIQYYDFLMAAFVCIMLCSNVIGAPKVFVMGGLSFGAGILFFPVSYLFGDILTEVYGFARARRVVWAGFGALTFATFTSWLVLKLPPAPGWNDQLAYTTVFGSTWRIVMASLVAFLVGEFCNSYVLAKMKIGFRGKHLWARFVGSTVIGEGVDTLLFYPLAFYANWSGDLLLKVMASSYLFKVVWEVVAIPITYVIVGWLKRVEQEDYYDYDTNFTPFSLKLDK